MGYHVLNICDIRPPHACCAYDQEAQQCHGRLAEGGSKGAHPGGVGSTEAVPLAEGAEACNGISLIPESFQIK